MSILKKIALRLFYLAYLIYVSFYLRLLYWHEYSHVRLKHLSKEDYVVWKNAMLRLMREHCSASFGLGTRLVYETFAKANIEVVRYRKFENKNNPIVVLCVKNDKLRLEMLVNHYRELGVKRFAFLDNGSTDGTYEWMQSQDDIDLFKTSDKYNCFVKEGWLNRVISYYGFERWYILTDSDELLTYIGMEKHPINDLIQYAQKHGVFRFKGLNLDVYADAPLFSIRSSDVNIKKTFCWMDSDSYTETPKKIANSTITAVTGGPRFRTMNVPCSVMKYPLVYFEKGTVSANAHYQYPYSMIERSPCVIGILHYKFLDVDKKEFERRSNFDTGVSAGRAKTGEYYRQYLNAANEKNDMSFMYEGSVRFDNSNSLAGISLINAIPFEQ